MKNFAGKNRRLQRALTDRNTHFKMYKAGKLWLYSGITMLTFGLVALQPTLAKADIESTANPTTIIGGSDAAKTSNNQASSLSLSQVTSASADVASSAVGTASSAETVNNDSIQPVTKTSVQAGSASLAKDASNVASGNTSDKKTSSSSTIAAGSLEAASLATSETDVTSNTGDSLNNRFQALTTALPSGYSATLTDGTVTVSGSSDDQLTAVKDLLAKNGFDTNVVINLTDAAASLNGNVIDPTAVAGAEYVAANSTDFQAGMSAATKDASLLSPMVFYALSQWLTPANAGSDNIDSYYAGLSVAGNFKLSGATNKVDYIAGYRYTMAQMYNGIYAFTKALTANIPTPNESTDTTYYDDLANSFWKEGTQAQAGLTAANLASLVTLFLGNSLSAGLASNTTLAPNGIPVVPRAGKTYTYVGYKASDNSYTFLTSNTDTADYDNFFSIAQINDPINNTLSLYVGLIADEATFNTTAHAFEQLGSMNTLGLVPTQNASAADVYAAIANNLNAVSNGLGMPATISELVSGMPEMDVNVAAYLGGKDPLSTLQLMFAYANSTLSDGFLHYIVGYDANKQQPIYLGTAEDQTTLGVETNGVAATKDTVMQYGVRIQYGLFGDIYTQLRQAIVYAIAGAYSVQRNKDLNIIEQGDSGDNKAAYEALISAAAPTFSTSSGLTITELAQKYADYQIAQLVALRTQAATDSENGKLLTSQADFDQWMLEAKGGQAVLNAVMKDSTSNQDVAQQTTYTAATNYASFGGATKQLYYDIYLSGVDETKYSIVQVKFQGVDANGNSIVNDAISRLATKVPVDIAAVTDPSLGQAVNTTYLLGKDLLPVPPAGWIYATNATKPQQSSPTIVTIYRDPSNPYSYTVKLIQASTVTFNPVNANTGVSMDGSWTETGAIGSTYNESSHQNIVIGGVTYYATDVTQLSGTFGSTDSFVTVQYLPATKVTYQFNAVDENDNSIQTTVASSWSTSGLTNDAYDMSTTIPTTLPGYTLQSGQMLTGKFGSANEILNVVFTRNVEAANVTINVTGTSTTDQLIKTVYYQIDGQGATMSVNVVQTGTSQVYTAALPNLHFGDNVTVWAVTPTGASLDQASADHLQMQDGSNQFTLNYIIPVQNATIQIQDDTTNTALTTALPTTGSAGSAIDFADFLSKNVTGSDNLNLVKILGSDGTDYTVTPAYFDDDTTTTQSFVIHVTHKIATATATTTQTIHYVDTPSSTAVTDNVQTISWNTSHDLFADTWQATPTTQTTAVESPVIAGYTPDKTTVPASSNETLTTQPADNTINVTYTANPATIVFNYVDDEESGKVISTSALLNGVTDQTGSYNVTVPTNYQLAENQAKTISYTFGVGETTLTVHLVHQHNIGTMTTNRTITYVGAGAKTPAVQTQSVAWQTDEDAVTGVITYTPTQADAVPTPAVAGYTPDQANVPATTFTATTTKPTDSTVTVTYKANPATVTVTYVDDDASGKTVGTPETLNGVTDEVGSYNVTVPTNYQVADGQLETVAYTFGVGDTALTVHLVHQHKIGSMTTNRIITYVGAGAKTPAAQTQPIAWQTDEDAVTGVITYTPTTQADAVTAPTVAGYTPDQMAVSATTYTPTTTKPTDNPVTVTYTANPATITVTYVDDDTTGQTVGQPEVLNGITDQTGSYIVIVPANYELAKAQTPTIAYTFGAGNTALTVHLIHQHVAGTMTTNRTITYVGAGAKTPANQTQSVAWQTDEDAVTGVITYTPTTQAEAVTSLNVAGYTADQPVVSATNFPVTTTKPTDSTVTVTYTANPATITVTYVDDDTNQTVGTAETLTGVTDGTGSYTVKLPANYQLAKDQAETIAYTFGVGDTPLIVHLIHQHVMGTMTINRIVTYTGAGDKTPANQTQPITWQTDEDAVTGVTNYTPTTQADAVSAPTIAGYTVDKSSVPATNFIKTTTQPTDNTVTVTYTANPATITVNYVDADDANNAVGEPVTLTGVTDGTGTYTVVVPTNYQLATGQSGTIDYVFAAGTSEVTVRLAHQHNIGTLTTNRTINYTGAGANTPAKQIQPITWQTDQDAVNGITTYTPTTQAKAVTTPSIVGYTADVTSVPDTTLTATTTQPADSNVIVTYTAVSTTFTVKATGGTTTGLGFDYSINGGPTIHAKFGDVIAATFGDAVTISNPDQQDGYTLDKKNNYAISSLGIDGSAANMLTVNYLKNKVTVNSKAVVRTIVYVVSDDGVAAPSSIIQKVQFSQTVTTDPNDGSVISTSDWEVALGGDPTWAAVTSPTFTGYTVDTPEVDAETVTSDTKNVTIMVTYTANNTGNNNTGNNNTGDSNTGNSNSGSNNTGDSNTGNSNSGSNNTGDSNTGNSNSGSNNTGDSNTGNSNAGSNNTGDSNTGNSNSGSNNTGDSNTGNSN
ncbi:mucin-binding protein, partial [Furfurilactobacillus curtus]|uniref:mucin-binding protein n=1 Tax=Furfurilactobacillus curtus TaxID=1746200 RepID=UPI0038B2BAF0